MRGTKKQIVWAEQLKSECLAALTKMIESDLAEAAEYSDKKLTEDATLLAKAKSYLESQTDCLAKDWIDARAAWSRWTCLLIGKNLESVGSVKFTGSELALWCCGTNRSGK